MANLWIPSVVILFSKTMPRTADSRELPAAVQAVVLVHRYQLNKPRVEIERLLGVVSPTAILICQRASRKAGGSENLQDLLVTLDYSGLRHPGQSLSIPPGSAAANSPRQAALEYEDLLLPDARRMAPVSEPLQNLARSTYEKVMKDSRYVQLDRERPARIVRGVWPKKHNLIRRTRENDTNTRSTYYGCFVHPRFVLLLSVATKRTSALVDLALAMNRRSYALGVLTHTNTLRLGGSPNPSLRPGRLVIQTTVFAFLLLPGKRRSLRIRGS